LIGSFKVFPPQSFEAKARFKRQTIKKIGHAIEKPLLPDLLNTAPTPVAPKKLARKSDITQFQPGLWLSSASAWSCSPGAPGVFGAPKLQSFNRTRMIAQLQSYVHDRAASIVRA